VYGQRQRIIDGDLDEIDELAQKYVEDAITSVVTSFAPPGVFPEEWDLGQLETEVGRIYDCEYDFGSMDLEAIDTESLIDELLQDVDRAYVAREEEVGGEEVMREIERRVILSVVDRRWREHLYEMDALRSGIGLRSVGQRDPLVEYQREAYDSFVGMMDTVKEEAVTYFFRLPVNREQQEQEQQGEADEVARAARRALPENDPNRVTGVGASPARVAVGGGTAGASSSASTDGDATSDEAAAGAADDEGAASFIADAMVEAPDTPDESRLQYSSPETGGASGDTTSDPYADQDVGRNDPCPCGSGKKYKKCHGG
jgi:preprotein translocase subunit SecA